MEHGLITEEKEYRKKPICVKAYQTDKELEIETLEGTMKANVGDFIITGVAGEKYPCKPDVFYATYDVEDTSINDPVIDNLTEWSRLVTELSGKELELYKKKEAYVLASEKLLVDAALEKLENDNDIIKSKYGGNNDKTRKKYVKDTLAEEFKEIKELEFSIDYLKRRISYLKQLVYTKTVLLEIKE